MVKAIEKGVSRRSVLKGSAAFTIAAAFQNLRMRSAAARSQSIVGPYGPLKPTADKTTGLKLIRLPEGFSYKTTGWTGDPLMDGTPTPRGHDGMAVSFVDNDIVYLVRNHEIRDTGEAFGTDASIVFDPYSLGGTSNLAFNTKRGEWLPDQAKISISGTSTNCAGGLTPWGSWLTCEETLVSKGDMGSDPNRSYAENHGWVFEVPADPKAKADPEPLTDMGRFVHEATAVDPATGYVYETQDRTPSGFYRFIPKRDGQLARGGKLEMLAIEGMDNADLRGENRSIGNGTVFPVKWVEIQDPERAHTDPDAKDGGGTFDQGADRGGAAFARLEGAWYHEGLIYFISTSGGPAGEGQVWIYDDHREQLTMAYASPDPLTLNNPDNIAVSPRGGILLCEDGGAVRDAFDEILRFESLMGLTPYGTIYSFAENDIVLDDAPNGIIEPGDYRTREWAGATFDPTGEWLFVNIQTPGVTFAITGPWNHGPL